MRDDIDRMKERAQNNNVFLYIKIPEVPFIVSYKGFKDKNIEDVDRFQLVFPLCEYHDKNWTWLDLALAIKQRCRRVLIQQVRVLNGVFDSGNDDGNNINTVITL
ncbi:unnamed protein product [Anisakis simplex]|uniref:Apt1 domain-containing protein n=1 Tax=Anisakis simplex TaxID=6269 RepID=A0A0M3KC54_ANISI|nr:unnamed protein product [Anisakis simplex]